MEYTQAIIGIIIALAGLVGAVALAVRLAARQSTESAVSERQRTNELINELRADITEKSCGWQSAREELEKAQRDIASLKANLREKDGEIAKLQMQIDTLTRAMDTMHANYEAEKTKRKDGEQENGRLQKMIAEKERMNLELFEANQQYAHEIDILRSLIIGKIARANELELSDQETVDKTEEKKEG